MSNFDTSSEMQSIVEDSPYFCPELNDYCHVLECSSCVCLEQIPFREIPLSDEEIDDEMDLEDLLELDLIDDDMCYKIGGAEVHDNGFLYCSGFDCECHNGGNCQGCDKSIDYWKSCEGK